jgi:hypothetical protein
LEAILSDLLANEGALLRRMLRRFLMFATMPDLDKLALAKALKVDLSVARAQHRLPYWPYWLDMLRFLHAHREKMIAVAPGEVARVIEMWLDFVPAAPQSRPRRTRPIDGRGIGHRPVRPHRPDRDAGPGLCVVRHHRILRRRVRSWRPSCFAGAVLRNRGTRAGVRSRRRVGRNVHGGCVG